MNITAENIKMKIGDNEILKGVSIDSKNREFVGIIGPNGSGKSTLLKSIYRILKPNDGCIKLDDMDISKMSIKESAKKMAVVSQHNYYNFDFTVKEVVSMGRSPHKKNLERDNIEDFEIVKESSMLMLILGTGTSCILFLFARPIMSILEWRPEAYYSLIGISFAPFIISIMTVFRGYFQGLQNMTPSAISQILEQIGRVIVGVGLAIVLRPRGILKPIIFLIL